MQQILKIVAYYRFLETLSLLSCQRLLTDIAKARKSQGLVLLKSVGDLIFDEYKP